MLENKQRKIQLSKLIHSTEQNLILQVERSHALGIRLPVGIALVVDELLVFRKELSKL